ncbi:conjugal transfer protein [Gluconobacter albidus]|uniref:Conjugal transfer protein n=1 Tax=Gluconobacter albidus TaxID=318683 RepID=A0A149TLN2_9PROT|nr:ArsA-related P-loop ATPase [Gluconobacter albidus]KXV49675.1 conjugal transfer protein [Gluconobacter albidus]
MTETANQAQSPEKLDSQSPEKGSSPAASRGKKDAQAGSQDQEQMSSTEKSQIAMNSTDVHFVMQGKGGVGKTTAAALLGQYLKGIDPETVCVDIDPVNSSFSDFKALEPIALEIMNDGAIDQRAFDTLMEMIAETPHTFVVDSGASTFLPLTQYLADGPVFSIFEQFGRRPVFHSIITGGPAQAHTMEGLATLLESMPNAEIVLWINEYHGFGKVVDKDGNEDWKNLSIIQKNKSRFRAIIQLPTLNQQTHGADMRDLLTQGMTFEEATKPGSGFKIMAQARLRDIWSHLHTELSHVIRS